MARAGRRVGAAAVQAGPARSCRRSRAPPGRAHVIALALETSTDLLSVAGRRAGGPAVTRTVEGARQHAARLFPLIASVLEELSAGQAEVETLALADGPGSFTGLRVGAAAGKALARTRPGLTLWT